MCVVHFSVILVVAILLKLSDLCLQVVDVLSAGF